MAQSLHKPIRSVKGTRDLLPPDTSLWQRVEDEARRVFAAYNFGEIRTPALEPTALFARSVGEDTDIVSKEMYTFEDRDHESLTLRPEATASVVRSYIEHNMANEGGLRKLYYIGPMFRRERPQKGRYRQFYQIGAEVLGSDHPAIDVELLEMLVLLLERLNITEFSLLLNSVGCGRCRAEYVKVLREALEKVKSRMCADCQRRADTNPLRVLDCKVPEDQPIIEALPKILDYLDPECRQHFEAVKSGLDECGIAYQVTPRLVRGLDYYTRTTFEITSNVLGAQNALLGGGRYDGLAEIIGGPPSPGIGFSIGEDRLVLAVEDGGLSKLSDAPVAYVAWLGEAALAPASRLARDLRRQGLKTEIDYEPMKLKKSLGIASKIGARFTIIIGEGELASGQYQVKDMNTGLQKKVEPRQIFTYLSKQPEVNKNAFPTTRLKDRCCRALSDALRRRVGDEKLDSHGYVRELHLNFVPGISLRNFEGDFQKGAGRELDDKMKAPYSSSALVVNAFGRWYEAPATLILAGQTGFTSLHFEVPRPSGLRGTPPHLDVLAENASMVVAMESKCTEYLDQKVGPAEFSPSYHTISDRRRTSPWFAHMLELQELRGPIHYKWLDAAQLIKHYLGLSHNCEKPVTLLYLYWEPVNWPEFAEFRQHRDEVTRFQDRVSGDDHVRFEHISYPDLWNSWRTQPSPDWLPDHVSALEERYRVSVAP